jgi:Cytochrome c554 and c-prime
MYTMLFRARTAGLMLCVVAVFGTVLVQVRAFQPEVAPPVAPAPKEKEQGFEYAPTSECRFCHVHHLLREPEFVKLDEQYTWQVQDPHALAYVSLIGPRGKQMARILEVDVTKPEAGCLGCHTLDVRKPGLAADKEKLANALLIEGVGCGACHGPSSGWIVPHRVPAWRDKTAKEKEDLGLVNLRDPRVKAKVCLSCHIGDAGQGKVVTHQMFAAGHPPLPSINIANFETKQPPHWYATRDVPWLKEGADDKQKQLYHYDQAEFARTKLALIGAAAAFRQSANLLRERATPTPDFLPGRWPELVKTSKDWKTTAAQQIEENWPELAMTHMDCAACHHDLQVPSWRQERGYQGAVPGRPTPPEWLMTLLPFAVKQAKDDLASPRPLLRDFLMAVTVTPFGDTAAIRTSAPKLVSWSDGVLDKLESTKLTRKDVEEILLSLTDSASKRILDFDSARQIVSLVDVIVQDLGPSTLNPEGVKTLAGLRKSLDLDRNPMAKEREQAVLNVIKELLAKEPAKKDDDPARQAALELQQVVGPDQKLQTALTMKLGLSKLSPVQDKALEYTANRSAEYNPQDVQRGLKAIRDRLLKK